jgi:hypothetical protein
LGAGFVSAFNHYFTLGADVFLVAGDLDFALAGHQDIQAAGFFVVGDGVF